MVKPKEHISSWITKAIVLNSGRRCVSRAVCTPHHCVSPDCVSSLEGAMRPTCWHPGKHLQYGLLKSQNPCLLNGTHGINSVVSVQIGNKSGKANSLQHWICKNNAWQVRTLNSIPHGSLSSRTTITPCSVYVQKHEQWNVLLWIDFQMSIHRSHSFCSLTTQIFSSGNNANWGDPREGKHGSPHQRAPAKNYTTSSGNHLCLRVNSHFTCKMRRIAC